MPYLTVCQPLEANGNGSANTNAAEDEDPVRIYYHTYGEGDIKAVLIMGFAADHAAWNAQLLELVGTDRPNEDEEGNQLPREEMPSSVYTDGKDELNLKYKRIMCVAYDNRGVGKSSTPKHKGHYTTRIMANDALSLMSHLGWEKAHIIGHSMGGMIACKLAAMAPERVCSLALVSVTGGGYHSVPRITRKGLELMYRLLRAKTVEQRARVDLDTHYSNDHLNEIVDGRTRREHLFEEYVRNLSKAGLQTSHGVDGHFNACWTHAITKGDIQVLESGNFLVSVIHGREDVIAHVKAGELVALRLHRISRMIHLPGGHMLTLEKPKEVNSALWELIDAAEKGVEPAEWIKGSSLSDRLTRDGGRVEGTGSAGLRGLLSASRAAGLRLSLLDDLLFLAACVLVCLLSILVRLGKLLSVLGDRVRTRPGAATGQKLISSA